MVYISFGKMDPIIMYVLFLSIRQSNGNSCMNPKVRSLRLILASVKAVKDLQLMAVNGKEPEYKKLTVPPRPEAKLTKNKPKKWQISRGYHSTSEC